MKIQCSFLGWYFFWVMLNFCLIILQKRVYALTFPIYVNSYTKYYLAMQLTIANCDMSK